VRRGARGLSGLIKYAAMPMGQKKFIKIGPERAPIQIDPLRRYEQARSRSVPQPAALNFNRTRRRIYFPRAIACLGAAKAYR